MELDLYQGIVHCNPRKLRIKVKDDFILECVFKWNTGIAFLSATKDIFDLVTYLFASKKDYLKFKEYYELELASENMKIKYAAGWYDMVIQERKELIKKIKNE